MAARDAKFVFAPSPREFAPLANKDTVKLLDKWCMREPMRITTFKFDQKFAPYDMDIFLKNFFNDPIVLNELNVLHTFKGAWGTLGGQPGDCAKVETTPVSCTATNMGFFDRLYECGAIRQNGSICGCIPEYVEGGYEVNQEMGKVLLMPETQNYDIFSDDDRKELIFRIFQHLTLGGPLNQYEDEIGPYFDTTKSFYKGLISVAKDPKTNKVFVTSSAAQIHKLEGLAELFPNPSHPQNFMYVIVNPQRREVTVWYHAFCG